LLAFSPASLYDTFLNIVKINLHHYYEIMKTYTSLIVRPYEIDSYNHVNNAVYQNYLEYARMDMLHQIGFKYKEFYAAGFFLYVTHVDLYYKASAVQDDELIIECEMTKTGYISGRIHQIMRKKDGTVCVEADVDWACVSAANHRPCKIPAEFMVPELEIKK